jgi:hypothetical protein
LVSIYNAFLRTLHGDGAAHVIRCIVRVLLYVVAVPSISDLPVHAQERVYLTKTDIEQTLIDKGIISRNLATGMVSRWEFRSDGSVHFVNRSGPGSASGTWVIHTDGLMCVKMSLRSGCRYWFRRSGMVANANSNEPNAPTVAEIQFE